MCGISGFSGGFGRDLLETMTAAIAHRGPDGTGLFYAEQAGLGHRRLSIIDVSESGAQPMKDESGRFSIVYNGELYNFRELRAELEAAGARFRGRSDTEVLINLYARLGAAMLERLNGIFAFAIHDASTGEILLARDRFGVKPLYYGETARGVIFASEMKALLASPDLDRTLDAAAIQWHLTRLWAPAPATMLKAVRKLEPGTALMLKEGGITRRWRFYALPLGAAQPIASAEAIGRVRQSLETAVARQMVSDVPVGAFLSGGLDSSAVVALARRAEPDLRLQCFTIDLDAAASRIEGMTPDLPYAKQAASHLGVDLHVVRCGPEITAEIERMVYHLDEPQGDPAALNVLMIAGLARQHGIKVLLSGGGGDDLFTGYRRHHALAAERAWSWMPRSMRAGLQGAARRLPARPAALRRAARAFRYAGLDGNHRLASYFDWIDPAAARDLLAPEFREAGLPDPFVEALEEMPAASSRLQRMLALECRFFLADHNLNYTDKMSMAEGVETRVPFLDNDLADLAFSLPDSLKQRGGQGKWVLKKAVEDLLPQNIVHRPKTGFGAPLRAWMAGPLRPLLDDVLGSQAFRCRGVWDADAVARLIVANDRGRVDASYTLFTILCIELWCRLFLDRAAAAAPFH